MRRFACAVGCLVVAVVAIEASVAFAGLIVLDASTDVWIREAAPDNTYENDGMSVWSTNSSGSDAGKKRRGAVEFDLSGVTQEITGAYLNLYAINNPDVNNTATDQTAASLPVHGTLGSLTWSNKGTYTDPAPGVTAFDFASFGHFNIAADQPNAQYYSSDVATSGDLVEINSLRTSTEKKLTLFLLNQSGSGLRDWGDAFTYGHPAQVVITTIPEPCAVVLLTTALLGLLAYAWQKRK